MTEVAQETEYDCEVYSGLNGLLELKKDWEALFLTIESPTYIQDWRWMHAVAKHLAKDRVYFVVFRKHKKVAMIFPLQIDVADRDGIKQTILSFPRHSHIVLSDLLYNPRLVEAKDINRIQTFLSSRDFHYWSLLELKGVCAQSQVSDLLSNVGSPLSELSQNAYFKVVDGQFDQTLSKKFIKNIKRLKNKAEKEVGTVKATFNSDAESLASKIEVFWI